MNQIFKYLLVCAAMLSGGALYAQKPVQQQPAQSSGTVQQPPREVRSDDKRDELSKKLLERKNELRKEDHEHNKEKRNTETTPKPAPAKKD